MTGTTGNDELATVSRILWLRPDSIGDSVLAASMLPHLKARYPGATITVLCQQRVAEFYEASPLVDAVIGFDLLRACQDEIYRNLVLQRVQAVQADLLLSSLYSRTALYDCFALLSGARTTVALHGDLSNISADARDRNNCYYSIVVPSEGALKPELERHRDFLSGIGITVQRLSPVFWTGDADERFASGFFADNGLVPERCIALFAGAQSELRTYAHYGKALAGVCKEESFTVLAFGASSEHDLNQQNLDDCGGRGINLSGRLTLRQTAALLRRCRLAVGAETGTAHICCAVGTPNVVLVGGGHFGRFMPYSPLTSVVCLPLSCYFCNWSCSFQRPHCVKDVHPEVLAQAVRATLQGSSEKIRIFTEGNSYWRPLAGEPGWGWRHALLGPYPYEIIEVDPRAAEAPAPRPEAPATRPGAAGVTLMAKAPAPRITLVTPSYNYGRYLEECIDSVLSQGYPNLEYIIMDGGSTDDSVRIIRKHERHLSYWQSRPDGGNYSAIEEGFKRSRGEIMTWLNADDKFHSKAFELAADIFSAHEEVAWLMGRPNSFDEEGRQKHVLSFLPMNSRSKYLAGDEFIQQEGVFWRRGLWERSGGYLEKGLLLAADLELWARFFRSARLFSVDTLMAGFRDHPLQKSKDKAGYTAEANRVLARERQIFAGEEHPFNPPAPLPILVEACGTRHQQGSLT